MMVGVPPHHRDFIANIPFTSFTQLSLSLPLVMDMRIQILYDRSHNILATNPEDSQF